MSLQNHVQISISEAAGLWIQACKFYYGNVPTVTGTRYFL